MGIMTDPKDQTLRFIHIDSLYSFRRIFSDLKYYYDKVAPKELTDLISYQTFRLIMEHKRKLTDDEEFVVNKEMRKYDVVTMFRRLKEIDMKPLDFDDKMKFEQIMSTAEHLDSLPYKAPDF